MPGVPKPLNIEQLTRAVRQLQAQVSGFTGPAASSFNGVIKGAPANGDVFNGVTSMLYIEPDATTAKAGGITVKRTESTWGVSAGTPAYGDAQPFEVLSPSSTAASDVSTDGTGTGGSNPVLARIDAFGGFGTVQGVHVSPGLRDTHGGGTPIGLWVQLINVDTFGVVVSGPDPSKVATPFSPLLQAQTYGGSKIWNIDSAGAMNLWGTISGTPTGLVGLYPNATPAFGHRIIARAGDPGSRVFGFRREASQTAAIGAFLDSNGTTLLSAVDSAGDWINFDTAGTTGVAALYSGDSPAVGFRAILSAGSSSTSNAVVALGLKQASSGQTGDLLATYNHAGTKIATIIDNTGNLVGAGSGVTSFNTRTGAVTLTNADITARLTSLGGALVPIQSSPFGYQVYADGSGGSFWGPAAAGAVTSVNGATGAVSITAAGISAVATSQINSASGVAGLDSSGRLEIPSGVGAPTTGSGAIGVGTLVGWVPVNIGGTVSKIPIFQ